MKPSPVEEARALVALAQSIDAEGTLEGVDEAQVVNRYAPLCAQIVRSLRGQLGVDDEQTEDMLTDAQVGLVEAWRRYDPSQGAAFCTFAYYRIKGSVVDGLRLRTVVRRRRDKAAVALKMARAHCGEAEPTISAQPRQEQALGRIDRSIRQMAAAHLIIHEAEASAEAQGGRSPLRAALDAETRQRVKRSIEGLTEVERQVILGIYFEERSLADVGQELGLSRSWLCRVHARALERLEASLRA